MGLRNKMYFNQKFEPKGNKILHGAGQSLETFKNYWNSVGRHKPIIYMIYIRINEIESKIDKKFEELKDYPNLMPQIGLSLKVKKGKRLTRKIIKGELDNQINYMGKTIKKFRKPIFLRIGYEFNNPNHKYNPKAFISAWRHIHNKFKENGINNVAFIWNACTAFSRNIKDITKFYPGDDYVDWFGNNLFGTKHFIYNKDKVTEDFCRLAIKHRKPLMICESSAARVGVINGKKSWNDWFKPYFGWVKNHKVVKAFCYINWDWGKDWKQPEWGNCRIEENKFIRKSYVKELSNKRYIHNLG